MGAACEVQGSPGKAGSPEAPQLRRNERATWTDKTKRGMRCQNAVRQSENPDDVTDQSIEQWANHRTTNGAGSVAGLYKRPRSLRKWMQDAESTTEAAHHWRLCLDLAWIALKTN